MRKDPHKSWFLRLGMILVAVPFLTPALGAVLRHRLFYQNHWGGPVFVPVLLFVGLFVLYLVIFRWKDLRQFGERRRKRNH